MEEVKIIAGEPITVNGESRAEVIKQLYALREQAKKEGLEATGGFIQYLQGLPGEPDEYKSVITFNKK